MFLNQGWNIPQEIAGRLGMVIDTNRGATYLSKSICIQERII